MREERLYCAGSRIEGEGGGGRNNADTFSSKEAT